MIRSLRARARLTGLLTRHLLHTMRRQRARAAVLWAALALALGIGVGLLAFMTSIEDSYRARGEAIGGVSDIQVEAVAGSSLPAGLAARLGRIGGVAYAIPTTQQRVALAAEGHKAVATAIGVDRSARRLRSAVQSDLKLPDSRSAKPGLALPTKLAAELGVRRGGNVRIFAYRRSPSVRVARVVEVGPAIEDVVTLPRDRLEAMRGTPGQPNVVYVKLGPRASVESFERRARGVLPENGVLTAPAASQGQLDHVLDFTVRAPTFVFGMVVLAIAGLLIYVLQLMRMLERQEDLGLLRALGSRRMPLIVAESAVLGGLLLAAIPPGVLIGTPIARYLSSQVPTYLTDVFGFNMQVTVRPDVVAAAAAVAFAVGVAATIGALASARGSIADQLGRSPQAGATVTSTISPRATLSLTLGGIACLALGLLIAYAGAFPLAAVTVLIGLALGTPGLVGLVALWLSRREPRGSKIALIARGAVEANPRRAALAAAIMALGVAAVVPPQLAEHMLLDRIDRLNEVIRPGAQNLLASDDAFASVPVDLSYGRRALRSRSTVARPVAFAFVPYVGRKIEVRGLVPSTRGGVIRPGAGLPSQYPLLRRHPRGVLVSKVMATGIGIEPGQRISLPTASGVRKLRVLGEVEDFAWPSGTVYMRMGRYRRLFRTGTVSALAVDRRAKLDVPQLHRLAPLHAISGTEFRHRIDAQMEKSTQGLLAMRALTLIAALVAVGGIVTTSVFSRRREWAVLRAMGIGNAGLLAALALETLLVMTMGAACGAIGGIVSYRGPTLAFLEAQGYVVGTELQLGAVTAIAALAVAIGTLAAALPAWLTARAPLADALSYE